MRHRPVLRRWARRSRDGKGFVFFLVGQLLFYTILSVVICWVCLAWASGKLWASAFSAYKGIIMVMGLGCIICTGNRVMGIGFIICAGDRVMTNEVWIMNYISH